MRLERESWEHYEKEIEELKKIEEEYEKQWTYYLENAKQLEEETIDYRA